MSVLMFAIMLLLQYCCRQGHGFITTSPRTSSSLRYYRRLLYLRQPSNNYDPSPQNLTNMLTSALSRAENILALRRNYNSTSGDGGGGETVDFVSPPSISTDFRSPKQMSNMLDDVVGRATRIVEADIELLDDNTTTTTTTTKSDDTARSNTTNSSDAIIHEDKKVQDAGGIVNYNDNPLISSTALAQLLWKQVLRPGIDSAIDATCGKGEDSVAIASILFDSSNNNRSSSSSKSDDSNSGNNSQLLCIDVLEQACQTTSEKLEAVLGKDILDNNVQILQRSHAPLPMPRNYPQSPLALVVMNLGYLLQGSYSRNKDAIATQTETTLQALADAACSIRIGGVISVMTYPATNPVEDVSVQSFMQGLALYSSKSHDWRDIVVECEDEDEEIMNLMTETDTVLQTLQRVYDHNGSKQTWRVYDHAKIGWVSAPLLITAMRIK